MAGFVFHVINRGARRRPILETPDDYDAWVGILREALSKRPIRLLNFCAMPTHFHLQVWPETDQQLPNFMQWFTGTHSIRWRLANGTLGEGAVYQGRYKAIPIHAEEHFLTVARYIERNPLRAGLIGQAEKWRWSSLWQRDVVRSDFPLAEWPVAAPAEWIDHVNQPQTVAEVAAIRRCMNRGCAMGNASWQAEVAKTLGIPGYFRSQGRPRRNAS